MPGSISDPAWEVCVIGICRFWNVLVLSGVVLVTQESSAGNGKPEATGLDSNANQLVEKLRSQILEVIPKNWSVRISDQMITVGREVMVSEANAAPGERPAQRRYEISLAVGRPITQKEIVGIRSHNENIERELRRLEKKMTAFECEGMDSAYQEYCFRPRTPAQQRLLDEHKKIRAKLQVLPEYFIDDHVSVFLKVNLSHWYERIDCALQVCDEIDKVKASLVALLKPYAGPQP